MSNIVVDDVVIGSGPTGWAACMGIWARGGRPVVIDIGYSETRRSSESVIRNPMVKPKLKFDSDHMYRFPLSALGVVLPEGVVPLSGARGGYSTVWGSGIQPVSEADVQEAPITVRHSWLESSKKLLSHMDVLGRNDLLSRRDPWPIEPHDQVATSTRFRKILERADNERLFESTDVLYGSPRLAITGSTDRSRKNACTLCGQCMSGCPEGSIFDSGIAIEDGIQEFGGEIMTGTVTKILREESVSQPFEVLSVVEFDVGDGRTKQIKARRIYLAAGPIGTPLILQKSGLAPSVIEVRDSQMFYSAFFSLDSFDPKGQSMATSQGYFSTKPDVSREQEFSMSVYEHSIDFRTRLEQMVPKVIKPLIGALNPITQRIVPGIGFLSQDVSGTIRLNYDGHRTSLELCQSQTAKSAIKFARKRLRRTSRFLGLIQLPNPFRNPTVGAGFHAGASMPMGEKPDSLVDWSGKLKALPSVRIVDASSLMRIKAGSHTFMAMANAHRIAQSVD